MNKIPVLKTISRAYGFAFGQLGTIIGLVWIPLVILAIGTYFTWSYYLKSLVAAAHTDNLANAGGAAVLVLAWTIIGLLIQAVAFVGVLQQALGLRHGTAIARFSLGLPELRVFGGLLSLAACFLLFAILASGGVLLAYVAGMVLLHSAGPASAFAESVRLLLECAMLFAMVRLGFMLLPAGIAEERVSLTRSWTLSHGNFWRILAVLGAVLLPLLIVASVAEWAILGSKAFAQPTTTSGSTSLVGTGVFLQQLQLISAHLPELVGISLLIGPFLLGLLLSAQAFGYGALTSPAVVAAEERS